MTAFLSLVLLSPAFADGEPIPRPFTADGLDLSPALEWECGFPVRCFALVCIDPDAPSGDWVHWVAYDIPGDARSLPEGVPTLPELEDGTLQGTNGWGRTGYGGPAPPSGTHRYVFTLYALDRDTGLEAGATADQLLEAIEGHVLATAVLTGTYGRR